MIAKRGKIWFSQAITPGRDSSTPAASAFAAEVDSEKLEKLEELEELDELASPADAAFARGGVVRFTSDIEIPQDSRWHFVTGSVVLTFWTIAAAVTIRWLTL